MQLLSMTLCLLTDLVGLTDQDCLETLCDTMLVGNLACYPSPRLTITCCLPTCIITTEIKFGVISEKIDVVNNASSYVINFVSQVLIVLSFPCCCVVVADFLLFLFGSITSSLCPVQFHHRIQHLYANGDKMRH